MSKIEPFHPAVLPPREGEEANPAIPLSLAARFEEPDLVYDMSAGYARHLLDDEEPLQFDALGKDKKLAIPAGNASGVVIARAQYADKTAYGIYCRYPLKLLTDINTHCDLPYTEGYRRLLMTNKAYLDPLMLAVPDVGQETMGLLAAGGEILAEYETGLNHSLCFSFLSDKKKVRTLLKAFEPGFFSTHVSPMVLDGPLSLVKRAATEGMEHFFACLVPVGPGTGNSVDIREILIEKDVPAGEPLFPDALELPSPHIVRHYPFIDETERAYISQDWEEDLRIESQVADCSAIVRRDCNEFALVRGEKSWQPHGVEALYLKDSVLKDASRRLLEHGTRAAKAFTEGRGVAAVWTPYHGRDDFTRVLFSRRPGLNARRAMTALHLPVPFGTVACLASGGI